MDKFPEAVPQNNSWGVQPGGLYDGGYGASSEIHSSVSFNSQQQFGFGMQAQGIRPTGGAPEVGAGTMPEALPGSGSSDVFTGMLATGAMQSARDTFRRGQAYVWSGIDKLSSSTMYHLFSVTPSYVRRKLLLLLTPYLKRWDYARHPEQVTGGQKYLAPRHDVNAPDLYIPCISLCTYCLLVSAVHASKGSFAPEGLYNTAWYAALTWVVELMLLKAVLYALGIAAFVPWLELLAYSGYMFFPLCAVVVAGASGSYWGYYALWGYGSLCSAVFLVRTMKRIIFHEVRHYGVDRTLHNYLLLGVAVAQFPLGLWLGHT
uniref:Integral membrane hrf1 family protein n=1 Tax=Tetraselmis sp. GSL018 TaxID=582737 RepID=A0A061SMH0_9CHLO|mmetsp:Transcript_14023/g.33122  ORF Transcript_14023/g.33122 Transcript_14023/m.33122 type:complete len:318 (+) Transcript_14023:133-1086(+)